MSTDEYSLDSILEEIKNMSVGTQETAPVSPAKPAVKEAKAAEPEKVQTSTEKEWSIDDIDKLLADITAPISGAQTAPSQQPEVISAVEEKPVEQFKDEVKAVPAADSEPVREETNFDYQDDEIDRIIARELETRRKSRAISTVKKIKNGRYELESFVINEPGRYKTPISDELVSPNPVSPVKEEPVKETAANPEKAQVKEEAEEIKIKAEPEIKPYITESEPIPDYDPLGDYEKLQQQKTAEFLTEKNRRKFFAQDSPQVIAESDAADNGPIDKPGIIISKGTETSVSGLDPMPTVVSADIARNKRARTKTALFGNKAKKAEEKQQENEEFPGQMMLAGFDSSADEASPEISAEEDIEAQLLIKRRRAASTFRIVPEDGSELSSQGDEEDESELSEKEKQHRKAQRKKELEAARRQQEQDRFEYTDRSGRKAVFAALNAKIASHKRHIAAGIFIEILLVIVMIIPSILKAGSVESALFSEGAPGIYVANAILLIAAIAADSEIFSRGLFRLIDRRANADTAAALSAIVAFVHNTVTAVYQSDACGVTPIFSMVAVLGFIAVNLAGTLDTTRKLASFNLCAYKYDKNIYGIHAFDDEDEVAEMSRCLMLDNAELLYSSKAEFPSNLMHNSKNSKFEHRSVSLLLPIAFIASVITCIPTAIITRDWLTAYTVFTGTFCICSPVFASLAPAIITFITNKKLGYEGSMIAGLNSAERIGSANGVVIDSADIFDRSACRMLGMIDNKKIRIDEVLVYAAAMVIKSGGPLRDAFEKAISRDHNLLPSVSDLVFEQRMGISARIHGHKILLGNRKLLTHHEVEVPDKDIEKKYTADGSEIMYLAVKGTLAAMFVVSYKVDENLQPLLETLENNGTQVLVRTNDVNVNENMLSEGFGISKGTFSILGPVAGTLYKKKRDEVLPFASIRAAHNGNAYTMLHTVTAAQKLVRSSTIVFIVELLLSILGFVGAGLLVGLSLTKLFTGITALLFSLFSLAAITAAGILSSRE